MGVIRLTFELILVTIALLGIIAIIPDDVFFEDFQLKLTSYESTAFDRFPWDSVVRHKANILLKDQIVGPESMVIKGAFIYSGLADGRIVEIDKQSMKVRVITRIGEDEKSYSGVCRNPAKCGRPLGLRIHPSTGKIIVIDPYFGLYQISIENGNKELIGFGENDKRAEDIKGFLNDIAIDPEDPNIIYVTAVTSRYGMHNFAWSLLEHENSGKVFAVDMKTKKVTKIFDNLYAPNGIEVSSDKKHLYFSECTCHRILKVKLDEVREFIKTGTGSIKTSVFADNLPGEVDNIRIENGEMYVPIGLPRNRGPLFFDRLAKYPIVRKAIGRSVYLSSKLIKFIRASIYDHPSFEELELGLGSGGILLQSMASKKGLVVVIDEKTGKIKRTLGFDNISFISEVEVDSDSGDLFIGSFVNPFLAKLSKDNK